MNKKIDVGLLNKFFRKIGLDFGSSRIRVCSDVDGLLIDQAACIAVDATSGQVIAVGDEAAAMSGRVNPKINVHWPVKHGVLHDAETGGALLKVLLQPLLRSALLYGPVIMVSVPGGSTENQRDAMSSLLYEIGAREVYTIAQPLAAGIGSGVPIADASGSFILHLGEGVVEAAVISLGTMVECQNNWYAGSFLKQQIKMTVNAERNLQISNAAANVLLQKVASAKSDVTAEKLITGKDSSSRSPKEIKISTATLHEPVMNMVSRAERSIQKLLSNIPPELTVDIIDKGLLLSGGMAQLQSLDSYLIQSLGMPVAVVDEPELAAIKGIETALQHLDEFKESLGSLREF